VPVTGDLLRALRLRRNVSQADLARAAGTTQASIARFERGESFPCAQTLSRMAFFLGASEAETTALLRGRWGLQSDVCGVVPGADAPRLDWPTAARVVQESHNTGDGLEDLRFLSARALFLSRPFRDSEAGRHRALAYLASRYAMFLSDRGRLAEAEAAGSEALRFASGDASPSSWDARVPALLAMAERAVYVENDPLIDRRLHSVGFAATPATGARRKRLLQGVRLLESMRSRWLQPSGAPFPEVEAAWVGAHLARYAAGLGDTAGAVFLAREAVAQIAADVPHYSGDRRLRQQLLARLLVRGGDAAEALSLLARLDASSETAPTSYRIEETLSRLAAHRALARRSGGDGWHRREAEKDAALLAELIRDSPPAPGVRAEAMSLIQSETDDPGWRADTTV
jgi:transcriptional regulator with XRE-family HTH domain